MPVIDAETGGTSSTPISPVPVPGTTFTGAPPPTSLQAVIAPVAPVTGKQSESVAAQKNKVRELHLAALRAAADEGWIIKGNTAYKTSESGGKDNSAAIASIQALLDEEKAKPEKDSSAIAYYEGRLAELGGGGGELKLIQLPSDSREQRMLNELAYEQQFLEYLEEDYKFLGGSGTGQAVESYLTTEGRKTKEIERQYEDFKDRVDQYNQMRDAETARGNNAIRMNIEQLESIRDGDLQPGMFQLGGVANMSSALSEILRPSIPDYVRPDYRLNQAVGLPGAEGFDNPNYDQSGFPMFARGTPRTRDLSGVDAELRPLVGTPIGFVPDQRKVINKPWPWGAR